jgi:hypothetical protein
VQHIKETGCKIVYDEFMRKFRINCSTRFVFKSKHVIGGKKKRQNCSQLETLALDCLMYNVNYLK